ncbi:MAG: tol-pal system protein YbgF [Methylococcaceae bacterium]|jgi:tol-pal system protein YbgF
MRNILVLVLLGLGITAQAEPRALPPVVDNGVYPAANTAKPATNTLYELIGRLEQLQVEVQQLTGKVEEQAYQLNELKKRQNSLVADYDERLQGLEGKLANNTAAAETPSEPNNTAAAPAENKPAAPAAIVETPTKTAAEPAPTPTNKPQPASENEKQQYQQAYESLRRGRTTQAITEFNTFISQYPKGEYASNAQYWLGEAHKVNQDVNSARQAFSRVVENYVGSPKVPDALLKLGYIEYDQQNWVKSREYLTRVTTQFADSTAAHLAAKKLLQLDEAQH